MMRRHPTINCRSLIRAVLTTGVLVAVLVVVPAAQASKAVVGTFGAPSGEGAGRLDEPRGVAVNTTGAGGVSPGDVYVVDGNNNRVEEFSAAGAFVRAFGYDVVVSGADNTGANEQQRVTVDATGGTFVLTIKASTHAATTAGSNAITGLYSATLQTGAFHVGDVVQGPFPAGTTITAVGTESLVLSAGATGTFPKTDFRATETTAAIPYNATEAQLQSALEALPAIGAGNVTVTGGPGASKPLTIEYKGALARDDVLHTVFVVGDKTGLMTAVSTGLTGGTTSTASIVTTVPGGGYEVCSASAPSDVCKAGPVCFVGSSSAEVCQESSAAGSLDEPSGIAVDQQNGNVYVTDVSENIGSSNSSVSVYSATGGFEGAFGWDVNASSPKDELQFCTVTTGCQRGVGGEGAGQLNYVDKSQPALGPNGHLYVSDGNGTSVDGNKRVDEFAPVLNGSNEVSGVSFVGAVGWDVVASGPDQASEAQKVTVKAGAGAFKLTFNSSTTGELAFNAPAKESEETLGGPESVEKALNALPSISSGGGSVTVTGGPGNATGSAPYTVTFNGGPLARTDVTEMVAAGVGLSGGSPKSTASVETYASGTKGLEYCVVARGDVCKVGVEGGKLGQFARNTPTSVAVDGSGALYVVSNSGIFLPVGEEEKPDTAPARVYKFTFPGPGELSAAEFAPGYLTQTTGNPHAVDAVDVAVNPENQHVLVAKMVGETAVRFLEFDSSGALLDSSPAGEAGLKTALGAFSQNGLAVGTNGRFYFSNKLGMVDVFGPPPAPGVSIAGVTNVGAASAVFHGTVTPLPPGPAGESFDTTYHFEYSLDGINWSRFPAEEVDVGDGSGSGSPASCPTNNPPVCTVEEAVTGLIPNSHYQVRLVATTGTVAVSAAEVFTTEPAPPLVSGTAAEEVGETSAELTGFVNAVNEPTTYHFEWGTDTSYGNRVPVEVDGSAGSAGLPVKVSATAEGLKAGTIYHFRLVASNPSGTTMGPDREFSSLNRYGLPDGRVPEQVSQNDKRPVGLVGQLGATSGQVAFQASNDGNGVLYPLLNGAADATAGGNVDYLGERDGLGWQPAQVTPPSLVPALSDQLADGTGRVLYVSSDLSCELIESFEPLTADTPTQDVTDGVKNLYRRNADGSYTLLSAVVPSNPGAGTFAVDWASAGCGHVLFESFYRLVAGAPVGTSILYEWSGGVLRLAGVRPDESAPGGESVASDAQAGLGSGPLGSEGTRWDSMSSDGSKVFFTAVSKAGGDKGRVAVFVRENGASTVDASQSQTATVDLNANYAKASADGSHVFLIANYGLATNGTSTGVSTCDGVLASGPGCDLYDYNTVTKTLTDVSADSNPADVNGAGVVGLLDASDDGSYVYFAARGQLVPNKGRSEAQNLQGNGTYNVYVSHEGVLSFVGLIATVDTSAAASGSDMSFHTGEWAADATPDGKHLLFVSKANVTGYDSKGVTEAYVYSFANGESVCVSCRPDGLPSVGTSVTEPITVNYQAKEGHPESTTRLQNRPRSISDDGRRVFFTMPDVLAAGAVNHAHNIYEWEAGRVYLLVVGENSEPEFTRYADSSASGNDVFFVTKAKLLSQDFDNTPDLYDLRVGGGFPEPEPEQAPCEPLADTCQGEAKVPLFEAPGPASEAFSGPGNQPPVTVSCKKGLVLVHGKCVSKKPAVKGKKTVVKPCRKGLVRKHGKCVRKASVAHRGRSTVKNGRAGR